MCVPVVPVIVKAVVTVAVVVKAVVKVVVAAVVAVARQIGTIRHVWHESCQGIAKKFLLLYPLNPGQDRVHHRIGMEYSGFDWTL